MLQTKYFQKRTIRPSLIGGTPHPQTGLIVVIPALDEPGLLQTLSSLYHCVRPKVYTEVVVVLNHAEEAPESVKASNALIREEAEVWSHEYSESALQFHILYEPALPARKAGVGLARKIGMDEAARRLYQLGQPDGGIVCLDADCTCSPNYLIAVDEFFRSVQRYEGCSIYFEHPMDGIPPGNREHILDYELHLRYLIDIQRWAGFPFAFQTIGSSMAVRAETYTAVGGMNTRQAGEDFYFLHKVIERGRFADLTHTAVFPSSRVSHRVPFGTGKAIADARMSRAGRLTYNYLIFEELRACIKLIPELFDKRYEDISKHLPEVINAYLRSQDIEARIEEIHSNTATKKAFVKRFFRWFNAFRLMKYMHFARDTYPDIPVGEGCQWLLDKAFGERNPLSPIDQLARLRAIDRNQLFEPAKI